MLEEFGKKIEAEVLDKYKVEDSKREAYRGRQPAEVEAGAKKQETQKNESGERRVDDERRWWVTELLAGWEDTMQKWYEWLVKRKKMHQQKVVQMIKSAEGSAGLLHNFSKPTAWRGGAQILKKEEENVMLLDHCEAKRKEWAKHQQCYESVQNVEDKPWKNQGLKKLEEALPRLKDYDLKKKKTGLQKTQTVVECDGFHPKVPLEKQERKL